MLKTKKANPKEPVRVIFAGEGGTGKSTAGAQFNKPVFVATESGLARVLNRDKEQVDVMENTETWDGVISALKSVRDEEHSFKSLVLDSITALEKMSHKKILHNSTKSMKTIDGGYGAGSSRQEAMFVELRELLEQIRVKRNMDIILIAHTAVKSAKDPSIDDDYDEFEMDMDRKSAAVLRQWCDALFYVRQNTFLKKGDDSKKGRVLSDDTLIAYTKIDPIFRAKNRYGMPKIVPFGFDFVDRFFEYVEGGEKDESADFSNEELAAIKSEILNEASGLKTEEMKKKILDYIETVGTDMGALKDALARVKTYKGEGK